MLPPSQPLAMPEFTELLTSIGAKREYCTQYFKAFDRNQDGLVDYEEFLLGTVAMVRRCCCCRPHWPTRPPSPALPKLHATACAGRQQSARASGPRGLLRSGTLVFGRASAG